CAAADVVNGDGAFTEVDHGVVEVTVRVNVRIGNETGVQFSKSDAEVELSQVDRIVVDIDEVDVIVAEAKDATRSESNDALAVTDSDVVIAATAPDGVVAVITE